MKDKQGNIQIPEDAFALTYKPSVSVSDYVFEDSYIQFQTSKGPIRVGLFDHLVVRITASQSRAHRYS